MTTPGCGPSVQPDLYSTQEGKPSWFPLVPSDWDIWASPLQTDQDSCPGWLPPVPPILSPHRRASLLVPLPLDLSTSLPPEFCPLPFVCFLCGTWHRGFMRKHCQLEEFINHCYLLLTVETTTCTLVSYLFQLFTVLPVIFCSV